MSYEQRIRRLKTTDSDMQHKCIKLAAESYKQISELTQQLAVANKALELASISACRDIYCDTICPAPSLCKKDKACWKVLIAYYKHQAAEAIQRGEGL